MDPDPRLLSLPHPLVGRFLRLLHQGGDLAPLYAHTARIEGMGEQVVGADAVGEALDHFLLKGVQIVSAHPLPGRRGAIAFATRVKGRFGEQSIHHEWHLEEGRITHHRITLAREAIAA